MDGFAGIKRYIVERSPHRRLQPNAGLMIADPDRAARRRSLAVAPLSCFHRAGEYRASGIGGALRRRPAGADGDLYQAHARSDPMAFVSGKEIYDHLETVVDCFDDIGNEIQSIVLEQA
jgi:hypothetical protein